MLRRTARVAGRVNEGPAKVAEMQAEIGRRPILGVGNSAGDREMLEWTCAGAGPRLALLVDHDDDEREFRYDGTAETVAESEPLTATADRLGWIMISMQRDWATVFGPPRRRPTHGVGVASSVHALRGGTNNG